MGHRRWYAPSHHAQALSTCTRHSQRSVPHTLLQLWSVLLRCDVLTGFVWKPRRFAHLGGAVSHEAVLVGYASFH